ncbi:MAG: hypothetical protein K0R09_3941 [Clostridiales bacterium]|nr:hypothetical protein [Clostridiales bacterium]
MRNTSFYYLKLNADTNNIISSGLSFNEFVNGIIDKPTNMLILSGHPKECHWHDDLHLDYITNDQLDSFYNEKVYDYGDFCWVDFDNVESLNSITKTQLAELLYLNHKQEVMNTFQFDNLKNKYVYIAHDDKHWVSIYMKNIKSYMHVVEHKLITELKGRRKSIAPFPTEIIDKLYNLSLEGLIFDFEKSSDSFVTVYPMKDVDIIDDIHKKLDRMRGTHRGINLWCTPRKRIWNFE